MDKIISKLRTQYFGKEIIYFNTINSTNIIAKEIALQGNKHGNIVIAEHQTEGKGRLGRAWHSPKGQGIWMSIILQEDNLLVHASLITLIAALSVAKVLNEELNISAKIKWPNDIIINNKKVCGILTETNIIKGEIKHIVVGIGINVNNERKDFLSNIKNRAISLREITGKKIKREILIKNLIETFEEFYLKLKRDKKELIKTYKKISITLGKTVKITKDYQSFVGEAIDISDNGELIIKLASGNEMNIISGEVSVRGIDGYL